MSQSKPKVIIDFEKLDKAFQNQIRQMYPHGYNQFLVSLSNKEGKLISALPFETEEKYYMVKMPVVKTKEKDEDEDFDRDEAVQGDFDDASVYDGFSDDLGLDHDRDADADADADVDVEADADVDIDID